MTDTITKIRVLADDFADSGRTYEGCDVARALNGFADRCEATNPTRSDESELRGSVTIEEKEDGDWLRFSPPEGASAMVLLDGIGGPIIQRSIRATAAALEGEREGEQVTVDTRSTHPCTVCHGRDLGAACPFCSEGVASDDAPDRDRAVESSPTPEADKWHKTDPSKPGNRELDICGDYCGAHHIGGTTWRFGSGDDCADPAYGTATLDGIMEARFVVAAIDNAVRESRDAADLRNLTNNLKGNDQ